MKEIIVRIKSEKYLLNDAKRKAKKWSIAVNYHKKRIRELSYKLEV